MSSINLLFLAVVFMQHLIVAKDFQQMPSPQE
jgi:hypothetical protein